LFQSQKTDIDKFFNWLLKIAAIVSCLVLILIIAFVFIKSFPILKDTGIIRFFNDLSWHPSENLFNILPMMLGTLLVAIGAILISAPMGIISAIFLHYYAPKNISNIYKRIIEILAGIPSVVYGFWGLVVLVPIISRLHPPGFSLLSGILILSMMILPTITLIVSASFSNLPQQYLHGASALGFTRWTTIKCVVLPASKSGIRTGIILALVRAIGETMAILMVAGNVVQIPSSIFSPVRTLTANIALEMSYALEYHKSALFVSGLVLIFLVIFLISFIQGFSRKKNVTP